MEKLLVPCAGCQRLNRVDFAAPRSTAGPVCGACRKPLPVHGGVVETTAAGLEKLIQTARKPVIVDFWAPWCPPCRMFAPTFEQAASQFAERFHFVKINTEADPIAGSRYRIKSIPTLVAISHGREIERKSGALSLPMFLQWLTSLGGRSAGASDTQARSPGI